MKLLLLEDELLLKESIEEFLLAKNYDVDSFENSDDAYDAIFTTAYDLLLLDVNVPGEWDGFALRKALADEGMDIPTIFVTSMSSADAMLQGYAQGCCDYIKKPFDLIELMLRVQQALKTNCFKSKEHVICLPENYRYDLKSLTLSCDAETITLTKRENDLLNLFIKHRNQVVNFEMLYDLIWDNDVDPANVRVQINKLRRKLPKDLIKNVYGLGYRFDCQ